jgi:adenylate cyclase
MYASIAGWVIFAATSLLIGPHLSRAVVPLAFLVMVPMLAGVAIITYRPRARRFGLAAAGAGNLIAGLSAVLVLDRAGAAVDPNRYADISTGAVALIVYFGCTIMRLPPGLAAATIAPYVLTQQAFLLRGFADDPGRQAAFTAVLWIAVISGLLLSAVLDRVSRHAFRQERVIASQQQALERERERSEHLLLSILPAPIAERLKRQPGTIAEAHDEVTVLFADVVGFSGLAAELPATELIGLLNEVFTRFDKLAEQRGVEKIKTIGDAYMAVAGLPFPRADHVEAGADLALAMREIVHDVAAERRQALDFRLGMHTGPVVAGVIGTAKFSYDLWGDTVNIAARMESHGVPGHIQVTDAVAHRLREGGYRLRERGVVDLKGKGSVRAWFLEGPPERAAFR